jgi:AraC-like DNA-binding protein
VLYLFHTPRPPLDRYIAGLWLVTGGQAPRRDRILPSGTVELVINLLDDQVRIDRTERCATVQSYSGAVVSGTYSAAFVVDAAQHAAMMGVHFRPGGAPPVLGVPSAALTEAHVDLADLWGETAARELRERLCGTPTPEARFRVLEHALLGRLPAGRRVHPAVQMALARFGPDGCGSSVGDVSRESGLSHRRLLTLFSRDVGLSPKRFCRILRYQRVHAAAQRTGRIDWTDLALSCGFYDQAHLANEFRRLSGLTPRQYEQALEERHHLLRGHVAMA